VVFQGSVDELHRRAAADERPVDLLLGNLLEGILLDLLPRGLADAVRPGGGLILSGLLSDQGPGVLRAAEAQGLRHVETRSDGGWRALVLRRG
jgi:ribosomal protein L11 methyltransferase